MVLHLPAMVRHRQAILVLRGEVHRGATVDVIATGRMTRRKATAKAKIEMAKVVRWATKSTWCRATTAAACKSGCKSIQAGWRCGWRESILRGVWPARRMSQ